MTEHVAETLTRGTMNRSEPKTTWEHCYPTHKAQVNVQEKKNTVCIINTYTVCGCS